MSGLTSNANLTGYRYGNGSTVGEQFPNVPIQTAPSAVQTVTLNRLTNTSTIYNPTVSRQTSSTITLNQLASTTQIYLPNVVRAASNAISFNRLESTSQIFLPTVTLAGGVQTITLNRLNSTTQVFLPVINLISAVTDTSDILDRGLKKRGLTRKEEETIAAQLLQQRQQKKLPVLKKKLINWKQLLFEQINGVQTVEELDAIEIPKIITESVEVTAAVLAEIERQKEVKRLELQVKKQELELKQQQIAELVSQQRQQLKVTRALYKEVLSRHKLAMQQAIQIEQEAALQAYEAEQKAAAFNKQRDQRIKRLKALMWLAKLDL